MEEREPPPGGPPDDGSQAADATVTCRIPLWMLSTSASTDEDATLRIESPPTVAANDTRTLEELAARPSAGAVAAAPALQPDFFTPEKRLETLALLGRGGFGAVHAARDRLLLRSVATKVLERVGVSRPRAALRFVEEAQITAQLDHPNIVPVHDLGIDAEGRYYFTMKQVQGMTLTALLCANDRSRGALRSLIDVLIKVCDAVSFAHARGVIHRDLKPDNIMVGSFGQVYVMDWGIARLLAGSRPSEGGAADGGETVQITRGMGVFGDDEGAIVGTIGYMAPEQARGRLDLIDQRTDVFALGGTLYHVLCGQAPHVGRDTDERIEAALQSRIPPPDQVQPRRDIPPGLARIAMKALAADPARRHQSVQELKADLEGFLRAGAWFATRSFAAGQTIVREGEAGDEAFIVTEGLCEVFRREGSQDVTLRRLGPGEVFGETAVFASQPRTASVRASTAATVIVVTRESLEQELGMDGWMASFVTALATRFSELDALQARTRRELEAARLSAAVLEYLLAHGAREASGLVGDWAACAAALAPGFGLAEGDLRLVLARCPGVFLDEARGQVRWRGRAADA
ncbi:MAG: protein kinase [Gammaproteobacteria bacterium]